MEHMKPVHAFNTVVEALENGPRFEPEVKKIDVRACSRDGETEYIAFVMVGAVTSKPLFDGKFKEKAVVHESTLNEAAFDLDLAAALGPDGLYRAYKAALKPWQFAADSPMLRQLYGIYVGLLALGHGMTGVRLSNLPSPFIRMKDGHAPEVQL
jgi:hypothetical protein